MEDSRSRRWDPTGRRTRRRRSFKAQSEQKVWLPGPAPRGAGGGRKPAGTPSPSREGPGNRGGAPAGPLGPRLQTAKRGVEWGRATPPCPGSPDPPSQDSGKSGRPGVSQDQRGRVSRSLGGPRMSRRQAPCSPGRHASWGPPQYVTQFPPLTPLHLQKKFQSCGGRNLVTPLHPETQGCHRPHKKEGSEVPTRIWGNFWGFQSRG